MAMCAECRTQISAAEAKRQKVIHDSTGRIVDVMHKKCWHLKRRRDWVGDPSGKYYQNSPDAYQIAARAKNADDVSPEAVAHQEEIESAWQEFLAGKPVDPNLLDDVVVKQIQKRQEELRQDKEKEDTPKRFDDWRDPDAVEF